MNHLKTKPWNIISSPQHNSRGEELDLSSEDEYDPGLLPEIGKNAYLKKSFSGFL